MTQSDSSSIRWIASPKWARSLLLSSLGNGLVLWVFSGLFLIAWAFSYAAGDRGVEGTAVIFGLTAMFGLAGALGAVPGAVRYPRSIGLSDSGVLVKTILGTRHRAWPDILVVGEWEGQPPGMIALRITRMMSQLGMGVGVCVVSHEQADAIRAHPRYAPSRQEVPKQFLVSKSKYDEATLRTMIKNPDALEQVLEYKRTHLVPEAQPAGPAPSSSR